LIKTDRISTPQQVTATNRIPLRRISSTMTARIKVDPNQEKVIGNCLFFEID
jgi:hypothetical protein